jgi:hypothetical protein
MKIKSIIKFLFVFAWLLMNPVNLNAQVTIGSSLAPQAGALLDIKEQEMSLDFTNASKGVLFPRVALNAYNELAPLFQTTKEPQKTSSIGMVVYNVNQNAPGLSAGIYVWDGSEWVATKSDGSSSSGLAELEFVKGATLKGTLYKEVSLTHNNIIELKINVKKAGSYNIIAYTDPYNGYYYDDHGEFLDTGDGLFVTLTGSGKPILSTDDKNGEKDSIRMTINGVDYGILLSDVQVGEPASAQVNFTIDCSSVDVSKAFMEKGYSSSGCVFMTITAPASESGKPFFVEANAADGIQFTGSGVIVGGQQKIALYPNRQTPSDGGIYTFAVTANSKIQPSCTFDVNVIGRSINVVVLGETGSAWDLLGADRDRGVAKLLQNKRLFGLNGMCPVEHIKLSQYNNLNDARVLDYDTVDVVIISYNVPVEDDIFVTKLIDFVNNKNGVVICGEDRGRWNNAPAEKLLKGVFGASFLGTEISDNLFTLVDNDNPVVKGKYMDLSNKKIGRDGGYNISFQKLPDVVKKNTINIAVDQKGNPFAIMHKTKHFILWGDGAPFAGGYFEFVSNSQDISPLQIDSTDMPAIRERSKVYTEDTYNAHIFVNIMMWAIEHRLRKTN